MVGRAATFEAELRPGSITQAATVAPRPGWSLILTWVVPGPWSSAGGPLVLRRPPPCARRPPARRRARPPLPPLVTAGSLGTGSLPARACSPAAPQCLCAATPRVCEPRQASAERSLLLHPIVARASRWGRARRFSARARPQLGLVRGLRAGRAAGRRPQAAAGSRDASDGSSARRPAPGGWLGACRQR